ncbi:RNA polymerase sigma factor [Cryptosporangium sp. NPDC051539]|uniref:RNA polymerase sigma factor n=1 Tax=Cryptosporangium sp. NPDC051539 TaxID=3363962 RepID=UPI0037B2EAE4
MDDQSGTDARNLLPDYPIPPGRRPPRPIRAARPCTPVGEFAAFYRAETPRLIRFLLWHGARLADAADLAQDAMVAAHRNWDRLDNPAAWIRTVAFRARLRKLQSREQPTAEPERAAVIRPDADLDAWEISQDILQALRRLPVRQRQVLAWSLDGFTPTEIAGELGTTPAAVRSSLYKARHTLAADLGLSPQERPR